MKSFINFSPLRSGNQLRLFAFPHEAGYNRLVKSSLADQHGMHRYKVWLLAQEKAGTAQAPASQNSVPAPKQPTKLTDLESLQLLYNYGRPMEIAVESKCTLPDGQLTTCETRSVSSESVAFVYNQLPSDSPAAERPKMSVGSRVSLELDTVGSFGGVLTSQNKDGFEVAVNRDSRRMLGTKLAQIAVKRGIGVDATSAVKTGVPRIEPDKKDCSFTDHTGTLRHGKIVNLSQYDALIRASASIIPPLGSRIVLRGPQWHGADVISTFEIGFIVKFAVPIPIAQFSVSLKFSDS